MRCAPRRDKRRLNWSLNLSFGWNRLSIPPPTAQFIAVVFLTNSGTVPEYFPEYFKGQSLGFLIASGRCFRVVKDADMPRQGLDNAMCWLVFNNDPF